MKIITDKDGDIHMTEMDNKDEFLLIGYRNVYQHGVGSSCKPDGGPFDNVFAYSDEGDKIRKEG